MKIKFLSLLLTVICFVWANGVLFETKARQYSHRDIEPQLVTLLSQIKHNDFAKANFNFKLGVRGDSTSPRTLNNYDLRYCGNSPDGNFDWFDISNHKSSYSQIIDMGALNWTDIYDIPLLYASPEPHSGMWGFDYAKGKDNIKITPENAMVKVVLGHIYLVHAKEDDRDLYAMFRVEALKAGDEVTISWKVVPSPESYKP